MVKVALIGAGSATFAQEVITDILAIHYQRSGRCLTKWLLLRKPICHILFVQIRR